MLPGRNDQFGRIRFKSSLGDKNYFFVLAKFIIPGRSKVVCLTSRHVPGFSIPWQFQSAGKNDPRQECWQIEFFAFHNNFKSSIYEFN